MRTDVAWRANMGFPIFYKVRCRYPQSLEDGNMKRQALEAAQLFLQDKSLDFNHNRDGSLAPAPAFDWNADHMNQMANKRTIEAISPINVVWKPSAPQSTQCGNTEWTGNRFWGGVHTESPF